MTVAEAKELVLKLIFRDLLKGNIPVHVDGKSSDPSDDGKFMLNGKPARVIHQYNGWFVPIELSWFKGSYDQPKIKGSVFFWYVFAIPSRRNRYTAHYFICDYLQLRQWVLEFGAPLGNTHQDHRNWRADVRIYKTLTNETQGYFRWGDEPLNERLYTSRVISLDNIYSLANQPIVADKPSFVGTYGCGGESEAHRRLKLYVAHNPTIIGLRPTAKSIVEYQFRTGDRVDILFDNSHPLRTVAEVELQGEENICTGIHQAIKYRSLAEVDKGYPLQYEKTRAIVVAYETRYERAEELANKYDVSLISVEPNKILTVD